jgi:hypothetical protein
MSPAFLQRLIIFCESCFSTPFVPLKNHIPLVAIQLKGGLSTLQQPRLESEGSGCFAGVPHLQGRCREALPGHLRNRRSRHRENYKLPVHQGRGGPPEAHPPLRCAPLCGRRIVYDLLNPSPRGGSRSRKRQAVRPLRGPYKSFSESGGVVFYLAGRRSC